MNRSRTTATPDQSVEAGSTPPLLRQSNPFADCCRFDCSEDHRQALDVIVAFTHGVHSGLQGIQEILKRACDSLGDPFDNLRGVGFELGVESRRFDDYLGDRRVAAVPYRSSMWPGGPPLRFPRRVPALGAPASPIGISQPACHLEDCCRTRIALVPAPGWAELLTVDRHRISPGEIPRCIECVNRHV